MDNAMSNKCTKLCFRGGRFRLSPLRVLFEVLVTVTNLLANASRVFEIPRLNVLLLDIVILGQVMHGNPQLTWSGAFVSFCPITNTVLALGFTFVACPELRCIAAKLSLGNSSC